MPERGMNEAGWVELSLACAGWVVLFIAMPHNIFSDALYRYRAVAELVEQGVVSSVKWPLLGSMCAIPLYALGKVAMSPAWWLARYNQLLFGIGLVLLDRLLVGVLDPRPRRRFLLLALVTSMVPYQLRGFGLEAFNLLGVAVGTAALLRGRWIVGSLALAFGVANMPATGVGATLAVGLIALWTRRLRAALPLALALGLILLENTIRQGGPFNSPYSTADEAGYATALPFSGRPGFGYPLFFGALSLLVSFGKGLVFFAPGLFLPLREAVVGVSETARRLRWVWVAHVVGLLLVYGQWWAWYGGFTWGPRFLAFAALPAALVLATKLEKPSTSVLENLGVWLALLLSCWVGLAAMTFGEHRQEICAMNDFALEAFCWYVPEFSVLWTPFVFVRPLSIGEWALVAYVSAVFIATSARLTRVLTYQILALVRRSWTEVRQLDWKL